MKTTPSIRRVVSIAVMMFSLSVSAFAGISYDVGKIPYSSDVTPTGARTYNVPIASAPFGLFVPSISLQYNSQSGAGIAGYGWTVGGLSSITMINHSAYYHGFVKAADVEDANPVFALDGVPLVKSSIEELSSEYPLETVTGHIHVKPVLTTAGKTAYFDVLYPNGVKARFGKDTDVKNRISYPVTKMTDICGRNIEYDYYDDEENGVHYIYSVLYNYEAYSTPAGRIFFRYEKVDSPQDAYYAGTRVKCDRILKEVSTYSGEEIFCTYSLEHEKIHGAYLLTSVGCSSGNSQLRPLKFRYPEASSTSPDFQIVSEKKLSGFPSGDTRYLRGRFRSGAVSDGIVVLPDKSNYTVIVSSTDTGDSRKDMVYRYGSGYFESDKIIVMPDVSSDIPDIYINAEYGFQTIEAIDVDSDGADELVKVNLDGIEGNYTRLKIKIYKFNETAESLDLQRTISVKAMGIVCDKGDDDAYKSPRQRTYLFGSFDGIGTQMVAISLNRDFRGNQINSNTCIVELVTGTYTNRLNIDLSSFDQVFACDIDSDGKTELCYVEPSGGITTYKYEKSVRQNSSTVIRNLSPEKTISGLNYGSLIERQYYVTDWNGDGYADVIVPPNETYYNPNYTGGSIGGYGSIGGIVDGGREWHVYSYTGNKFEHTVLPLFQRYGGEGFMFLDANRDRLPELLHFQGKKLSCYINADGDYKKEPVVRSTAAMPSSKGVIYGNIVGYNAMSGLITVDGSVVRSYRFSENRGLGRVVTELEDSHGLTYNDRYVNLMDSGGAYSNDLSRTFSAADGFGRQAFSLNLLSRSQVYSSPDGSEPVSDIGYSYTDALVNAKGLGFCGFGKVTCVDEFAGVATVQEYDPERFGILLKSSKSLLKTSEQFFETVENTYDTDTTAAGLPDYRLVRSINTDNLTGIITTTSIRYCDYDNVERILVTKRIGNGFSKAERQTFAYQNSLTASKYVLGQPKCCITVKYNINARAYPGQKVPARRMAASGRKTEYEYDDCDRVTAIRQYCGNVSILSSSSVPISSSTALYPGETDKTELVSETHYEYDSFGHVVSEKSSTYGASEFVGTERTYNYNGRYVSTETDALGRTVKYLSYNMIGRPERIVDDHGNETVLYYDSWGNVIRKETPDGGVSLVKREWGGSGFYTVTDSSNFSPATVTHYDALGRKVRSETARFDGQWQKTDYVYDRQGRLAKVSLPYRGTEPSRSDLWKTYTYDAYGRLTKELSPGHSFYRDYDGVRVREIRDGVGRIMTADAAGNIVEVVDDGGTIRYTLRNDGQPSAVSCGDYVTNFTYDKYGRRTSITDPSAGTQTDTTSWSSDGTSVRVQTNPNGKITTWYDKYGRTVKVDREGEYSTFYVYDSYGRLQSESSTNGTAKEYTYDGLDRPVTEKEIVPDGKWLLKTYGYAPGSRLESTRFDSQNGYITVERYQYANDNLLAVSLSGRHLVLGIAEENDLGQPVHVESGNISRIYEYTPAGLPVTRSLYDVGDRLVQNFRYEFREYDSSLMYRSDMFNGTEEYFDYDALNRLVRCGDLEVGIAANGNVMKVDGVGEMGYLDEERPYQITAFRPEDDSLVPTRSQSIDYTCYGRPSLLREGGRSASFTYNGVGDRVKMFYSEGVSTLLRRYYIGGRYELDEKSDGSTVERLYVGGDAYSAPAVLEKRGDNGWELLNIGRDYLGSITHVLNENGTVLGEYSYDAWGRLRDPETLQPYAPGTEPELRLGRGFTAHEHLPWFGLINMNARLYDPLLCRFLSPDPYVQAPDFTQSFNRYSYALNNPLAYSDPNGEFVITATAVALIVGATVGVAAGIYGGWRIAEDKGATGGKKAAYMIGGGLVGGVAGLAGGYVGIAAGAYAGVGGFVGGAYAGCCSGVISGWINGYGMARLAGDSRGDALAKATVTAAIGGASGAVMGGLMQGFSSWRNGASFWDGTTPMADEISILPEPDEVMELKEATQGMRPYDKGKAGVDLVDKTIKSRGGEVVGREATLYVGEDKTRIRVDLVAKFGDKIFLVEVKTGMHATFTKNQSIVYPQMLMEPPIIYPAGQNALDAIQTSTNEYNLIIIQFKF